MKFRKIHSSHLFKVVEGALLLKMTLAERNNATLQETQMGMRWLLTQELLLKTFLTHNWEILISIQ
jgi:hypothetical protein